MHATPSNLTPPSGSSTGGYANLYVMFYCHNYYYNCPIKWKASYDCLGYHIKQETGSCTSNSQCNSGSCKGGNCCTTKGLSAGCTSCYGDGDCKACDSAYYISSYQCYPDRSAGSA